MDHIFKDPSKSVRDENCNVLDKNQYGWDLYQIIHGRKNTDEPKDIAIQSINKNKEH